MRKFLIGLIGITTSVCLQAQQSISVRPEKNSIILGEPLKLNITITGDKPYEALITDSLGHFEVLRKTNTENTSRGNQVFSSQQLLVTCFDSGRFRIPPVAIRGNEAIVSAGFDVMVTPLPADSTTHYGDIKQVIDLESKDQMPYKAFLALLAAFSAWMIWWLNRKYAAKPVAMPLATEQGRQPSLQERLKILRQQWENGQIAHVEFGNELMDLARKYLSTRGIYSKSKTGEELIILSRSSFDADAWRAMTQTIRLCNALRFGKFRADHQEGMDGLDAIEKIISQPMYQRVHKTTET